MKKLFPLLLLPALMASCSNSEPEATQQLTYPVVNLIVPHLEGANPYAATGFYTLDCNVTTGIMRITTTSLFLDGKNTGFESEEFRYSQTPIKDSNNQSVATLTIIDGGAAGIDNMEISRFKGYVSSLSYSPKTEIAGYPNSKAVVYPLILTYSVGNFYDVATFPADAFYGGTTVTKYATSSNPNANFNTKDILYRLVFKESLDKADLLIYEGKFAAEQPKSLNMILKNLDVEYTPYGYRISGTDVIPEVPEGLTGQTTPYPRYVFKSISGEATRASGLGNFSVTYTVGEQSQYTGFFTGSCAPQIINSGQGPWLE